MGTSITLPKNARSLIVGFIAAAMTIGNIIATIIGS